jgi:hypothetical protein
LVASQAEMFPNASGSTEGLYCCQRHFKWKDLHVYAFGSEWKWICPTCQMILRIDALSLPSDLPCDLRACFVGRGYV